jgi:hypothetical protein
MDFEGHAPGLYAPRFGVCGWFMLQPRVFP